MANYQLKHLTYPDEFDKLEIDYSGNKVECDTSRINPDHTIYLSKCKVNGKYVKSDKNKDGYYHYGTLKMTNIEYVDTYGKNLEDALKKYHDEHNEYPSDYTTLVLEELDKEVNCDVQINYGGKVYLTNCTIDNEEVKNDNNEIYVYGKYVQSYSIGDMITYNDIIFYVIEDSNSMKDYVTLLKAEPLTKTEVDLYGGVGTENNHVNRYTSYSIGSVNQAGGMSYYSTETCGYINGSSYYSGCTTDYNKSDIKYVVDAWAIDTISQSYLVDARLLKIEDFRNNLGYADSNYINENVPSWVNIGKYYWTMSQFGNNRMQVWCMFPDNGGTLCNGTIAGNEYIVVRPVLELRKSALE